MVDIYDREIHHRIMSLERQLKDIADIQQTQGRLLAETKEQADKSALYGHQNYIRNGDLSFTRNTYLYTTDYSGGTGEDQNVSEEAAFIYTFTKPTEIEGVGSITAGANTVTLATSLFVPSDVGKFITVYGAGTGGSDLVATIITYVSGTQCQISLNAVTTVTNGRVRFRYPVFAEDTTDNNTDANLATNSALKTPNHTRYGTTINDPDFDKVNGLIRYSDANNVLAFPFPQNVLMPGRSYVVSFLYKLSNDVNNQSEVQCDLFVGFWDNTFGRNQYLEGNEITLNGSVVGTPGSTTREYTLLMSTVDGGTIRSKTLTLTNTPATLNSSNYVQLSWEQEASVVSTILYRKTGTTIEQIAFPFPANIFYDTGGALQTVGSVPLGDKSRFTAKLNLVSGNFAKASSKEWRLAIVHLQVPKSYNKGNTTDKQWLVIGLNNSLTGTGSTRALLLDKISVDDKYGFYTICPLDFNAKRNTSTTPTSGDQGGIGIPIPPGGGDDCACFDDYIETDKGKVRIRDIINEEFKYKIKGKNGRFYDFSMNVTRKQKVMRIVLEDGTMLSGSLTHRVFVSEIDVVGKPLNELKLGDGVFTTSGVKKIADIINLGKEEHTVRITVKSADKSFWQNGVCVHNSKPVNRY